MSNKFKHYFCPNCHRTITSDSVICPYCKCEFMKISRKLIKNERDPDFLKLIDSLRANDYNDWEIVQTIQDVGTWKKLEKRGYTQDEFKQIIINVEKTGQCLLVEAVLLRATPEQREKILRDIAKYPQYTPEEIAVFYRIELSDEMRDLIYENARKFGTKPVEETQKILAIVEKKQEKGKI